MRDELDLPPEEISNLIHEIDRRLANFVARLPDDAAASLDGPGEELLARFAEPPPESGAPVDEVLDFLFEEVIPVSFNAAGPGYLAYVPGGGLPSAGAAEYLAAIVNRYTGVWVAAPAAVELETQAIRWLAELLGMARGALGVLTSGGSVSNLIALVAAREKLLRRDFTRGTLYVSSEVHHSLRKAARVAGLDPALVREVPVDDRFRMRPDALAEIVKADRAEGYQPFFVCATTGTVNTGAVDPLATIADVAEAEKLWLHVDGAYGGVFRLVDELAPLFVGIERADSFAVDPHKGLFLAYGTGLLLVRDIDDLRSAFGGSAPYLPRMQEVGEHVDFCEVTPELSRDWRGLRLWLPLRLHGAGAFRHALREKRELTLRVHDALRSEPDVEIASPPELSLFAFRQRHPGTSIDEENRRNRDLLDRINDRGRIFLTGTTLRGSFHLRVIILHLRTHADRVEEGIEILREELRAARTGIR